MKLDAIRQAIEQAIREGWTLKPNVTTDDFNRTCCALGAVAIVHDKSGLVSAGEVVGIMDIGAVENFVHGFDDMGCCGVNRNSEEWRAGNAFRKEYCK